MPVQFPTLSTVERDQRIDLISKSTLYPYTYIFAVVPNSTDFTGSFILSYASASITFRSDDNMAISCIGVNYNFASIVTSMAAYNSVCALEISYAPTPSNSFLQATNLSATTPIAPSDKGNIIYRNLTQNLVAATPAVPPVVNVNNFLRFEPYNYLLKFNQRIYIHFLVDATTVANGVNSLINGSVTFHMLPSGTQT